MTSQVMEFSTRGCYSSEMLAPQSPGRLIRSLRTSRRLSQEALAHRAGVSTRHLSCLESGRSRPSRTMLLGLGEALDLPLRDRNTLLVAAGFAPVFRMSPLEDPAMNHIHHAVEQILRLECAYRHEPFGGLASRVGIAARWAENEGNLGAPWRLGWETTVRLSAHR